MFAKLGTQAQINIKSTEWLFDYSKIAARKMPLFGVWWMECVAKRWDMPAVLAGDATVGSAGKAG